MSVRAAVDRDLKDLPEKLRDGGLAWTARALADELDAGNSATSKAMCAKALQEALMQLRALAPPARSKDGIDELNEQRERRRRAAAAAAAGS